MQSRDLYDAAEAQGYNRDQIKRAVKRPGARRRKTRDAWVTELDPPGDASTDTDQGSGE